MPKTIEQLKQDLATYRASKAGTSTPATTTEVAAPAPVVQKPIDADLAAYRAQRASGAVPNPDIPKDDPNLLAEFAKGIFSAPATIVARPFQAAAELAGAKAEDVDKFSSDISGGLIAPVPQGFKDVKKDVGRAAQTVALGTGAPITGGALFGAGASLEAGNDLLSAQTAFDAALGGAGGKVLDLVGKPFINAAGKVVGVITPQIIKDVAAGGAKAIASFAARHEIPVVGGITKPLSEGIEKTAQGIDNAINTGTKKAFDATKKGAAEQFPGLDPTEHFKKVNEKDIVQATTINKPAYNKATAVYNDAKARDIDLGKAATENRIQFDDLHDGKAFNTKDTAEALREANYKLSADLARPVIQAAQQGVRRIPIAEVRGAMLKKIHDIPNTQIDATDRAKLIKQITQRYADEGAEAAAHPNGYNLEELHDARIIAGKNGGYKVGASASDSLAAQRSREEARVFATLFDRNAPDEAGLKAFRKELEKNFLLADYLEQLHSKAIPEGVTKKAVRLFGRAAAATFGGKIGGFPGAILGSQYGDMLFRSFEAFPNPIKKAVLDKAFSERATSPVFDALRQYLGEQETARLLRKALPAPGESSYKKVDPTLFTTPGGKTSADKGEAFDVAAVEEGRAKTKDGLSPAKRKKLIEMVQENGEGPYIPASELPVIKAGRVPKKPKGLNDIL